MKPEDRFKYFDDLSILQLILLSGILMDYKIHEHIPSDIATDEKFLPPSNLKIQENLNEINTWTQKNLMKLNPTKSNYMIFSRSKEKFSTRLKIGDSIIERKQTSKILGLQISDDLSWTKNVQEICKKSYSRMTMITKLKYVGVKVEDLLDVYKLYIRSIAEY